MPGCLRGFGLAQNDDCSTRVAAAVAAATPEAVRAAAASPLDDAEAADYALLVAALPRSLTSLTNQPRLPPQPCRCCPRSERPPLSDGGFASPHATAAPAASRRARLMATPPIRRQRRVRGRRSEPTPSMSCACGPLAIRLPRWREEDRDPRKLRECALAGWTPVSHEDELRAHVLPSLRVQASDSLHGHLFSESVEKRGFAAATAI